MTSSRHLILVNLGTPTAPTPDAVRVFLDEFLCDPAVVDYPGWFWRPILRRFILRSRPAYVAHQYASIWTSEGSPLRVATERIAHAARALAPQDLQVHTAYRYGEPSLDMVMQVIAPQDPEHIAVVPLFPQRTNPTTGTAVRSAIAAAARAGIAKGIVERIIPADDPGYIAAMAARWKEALATGDIPEHIVISFHGIPRRFDWIERGTYVNDCNATTRAFLEAIEWPAERATLSYQSKFGPEPWLKPATADVLLTLAARGVKSVAVITPGFVTEGLETIEEIGIRGAESFRAAGGERLLRIGAVDDHPEFIASLVALAR